MRLDPEPVIPPTWELFCRLPTPAAIIWAEVVDDFLVAFTDDGMAWVIDEHGAILHQFTRAGNC